LTPILDRIRAAGAEVRRDCWRLRIVRRGRLGEAGLRWVAQNRARVMRELWPLYDEWEERAAIREYDGGQDREAANDAAYDEVQARV